MNKIPFIALGLALALTGCQTDDAPVSVTPVSTEAPQATVVEDYVGQDGLQSLKRINELGLAVRVHPSELGSDKKVLSQLPLPGDKQNDSTVIDLVVSGTQADIDQLIIAARPVEKQAGDKDPESEAQLAALRETLGQEYELNPELVNSIALDNLENVAHVVDTKAELKSPEMNLRSLDKGGEAEAIGDKPAPANTSSGSNGAAEKPIALIVGDPNGPVKFPQDQTFTKPAAVKVGRWSGTFPGETTEFSIVVQGQEMRGSATRLQDGRILTAACAQVGKKDMTSLGAGAVDQILLYAPVRYGEPIRSGRSDVSGMPAVSTVAATDVGAVRVITWYGYGELCDITLPMNSSAASDNPAYELAESMTISK